MHWILSLRGLVDCLWLVFLGLCLRYFWKKYCVLRNAEHWLITSGRITEVEWVSDEGQLWPKIKYSYEVYARNFEGEYFFLDTSLNNPTSKYSRLVAYKATMAFKEEKPIEVYYNPNNPLQAALDVSIPRKLRFIIAFITGLLAFHLSSIIYSLCLGPG